MRAWLSTVATNVTGNIRNIKMAKKVLDKTDFHYLKDAFAPTKEMVGVARDMLKGVEYDTLIGTGLSGALVIPIIARALRKNYAIVRKGRDGTHSRNKIEGRIGERWVFVDDLISTGNTRSRVKAAVKKECKDEGHETTYVGSYFYCVSEGCGFLPASSNSDD